MIEKHGVQSKLFSLKSEMWLTVIIYGTYTNTGIQLLRI